MRLSFLLTLHVLNYTFMVTRLVWQNYGLGKLLVVKNQLEQIIIFQGGMVAWHGYDNFHTQIIHQMEYAALTCMHRLIALRTMFCMHHAFTFIYTYTSIPSSCIHGRNVKTKPVRGGGEEGGISDRVAV